MERVTKKVDSGGYEIAETFINKKVEEQFKIAIEKLGKVEDMYEDLQKKQKEMSAQMDVLRNEGKEKSVKFRELLGNKIINNNILALFALYM